MHIKLFTCINCTVSREVKNPACSLDFHFFLRKKIAHLKVGGPKIIFHASFFLPE